MSLPKTNPTITNSWNKLAQLAKDPKTLQHYFADDASRAAQFSIAWDSFFVDYSKNHIDKDIQAALLGLAKEVGLEDARKAYFSGETINQTEGRAVLHTAIRAKENADIRVEGENVVPEVYAVRSKIRAFTNAVIAGERKSSTGQAFTDVVNIGIGGSDLGPAMITEALAYYKNHLNVHFMSNVDGDHVMEVLKKVNPATTLFVVVSKTFSTQETLTNATTAKQWLVDALGTAAVLGIASVPSSSFSGVSTAPVA